MFLAIVASNGFDRLELDEKSNKHFEFLQKTKLVGKLAKYEIAEGLILYFDELSSHHSFMKREHGISFLAGYSSLISDKTIQDINESNLDGEFIAFDFDKAGSICRVFNSFAGSWPIYYAEHNGTFIVSNDVLYIAGILGLRELDILTFYQLLTFGHRIGNETTIKGVRALQINEEIEINLSEKLSWKIKKKSNVIDYDKKKTNMKKTLEALMYDTKSNSVITSKISKSIIQLSGGLDSRLTLGVISKIYDFKPMTQTLVIENENESYIAREVAESLGYDNVRVELKQGDEEILKTGWALTSGQISPYAAATNIISYRSAADLLSEKEVYVIGAWPGDCLIGSYIPRNKFFTLTKFHNFTITQWVSKRNLTFEELGMSSKGGINENRLLRETRRILKSKIFSSNAATPAQKISYWAMFYRQPNFSYIAPSVLTNRILQLTPVLGKTYIIELLKLSANDIYAKNFYRNLVLEVLPEAAHIVYDRIGKPINSDYEKPSFLSHQKKDLAWLIPNNFFKMRREIIKAFNLSMGRKEQRNEHKNEEVNQWEKIVDGLPYAKSLLIENTLFSLKDTATLHAKSIFLSQYWTLDYLYNFGTNAIDN
jgi:hypothetical protein